MANAQREANKNRLIKAMRDLGGLPAIFSAVVGAPSLLSLLELVTDYRLSAAFQWIVDDYHRITALMALAVEPLVAPIVANINVHAGWHLVLYPHWRPLFLLMMVYIMGMGRVDIRRAKGATRAREIVNYAAIIIGGLIGALFAGLISLQGRWWEQGLLATIPYAFTRIVVVLLPGGSPISASEKEELVWDFLVPYIFAVGLSFVPGFERSAGVASLAALLVLLSLYGFMTPGLKRMGFSVLGGFLLAGMILGADAIIKALA